VNAAAEPSAQGPDPRLVAELEFGISLGQSPQPESDGADGDVVTRPSSWWNHLHCRRCGQTFRRGDRVRVNHSVRQVEHLAAGLDCGGPTAAPGETGDIVALRQGLLSTWPVPDGLRIRRLSADDWRLPRGPGDLRDANVCLHCGHTFRAGEYVIVCPCRPAGSAADGDPQAAGCGRAVHRDPAAGRSCWESWRPNGVVTICPVTQVRVTDG
jgi:hypothetical protein